jgi:putative hemolysin
LRLRVEAFNLELREGLESFFATGWEEDEFDLTCRPQIVEHRESRKIIGMYRLQAPEMAAAGQGLYNAHRLFFGV